MNERELQQALNIVYSAVLVADSKGSVTFSNPEAERQTGWNKDEVFGRYIDEVFRTFHEETCEPLESPLLKAMRINAVVESPRPTLLIRRDGNELYIESKACPICDGKGVVTGGVLVFQDVSESRELDRRLSYHASYDILTGLVNRREFESRLERALKSAKARETAYALLYLDLDQFKIVNDTCGHSAGDTLLHQLGNLLKAKIRWRDTLARLGGDEFGVLLESCDLDEAMKTAEELRVAVAKYEFIWDDHAFRLGVSIGLAAMAETRGNADEVLVAAESACRRAKRAGGNTVLGEISASGR